MKFLHILGLVSIFISASYGQRCPYAECTCAGTVIDCSNLGLTAIPNRVDAGSSFTTLILSGNSISNITRPQSFPVAVHTLDLRNNPVALIDSMALYEIGQSVKVLRLSGASFTTVPDALEVFDNLETLDIEGTGATMNFPVSTASKLGGTVLELRLVNLNIRSWPAFLQYFVFLRKLYLDSNTRLGNPAADTFSIWRHELTHLSLSNTYLSETTSLSVLEKLQYLDLSRNRLADTINLSYDLIPLGATLTYLDLSYNSLTVEPRLVELRVLTEVNLSNNKIDASNAGAFYTSVRSVNLDNNLFTTIPDFITELSQVTNFTIRNNAISSLAQEDFPVSSRLVSLSLGGNPISSITQHAFDNVRSYLTYLDLENTHIDRLPVAITILGALQTLWIPNNSNMQCTCDEKAIATWIVSRPTLAITGHCGSVDIRDQMTHLATLCP